MLKYVRIILKWLLISLVMGVIGGAIGSLFHALLEAVTHTREKYNFLILLLPLAGLLITALYHPFFKKGKLNTNRILWSVEADDDVPLILTPLIFVGTVITHLFGGSAGREGAALQLGGSIGYNIGKFLKLNKDELHIIVMSGMASFFAAMFGAPLTAAVFSLEVINAHNTHRKSLLPCILSSSTAYIIARFLGTEGVRYSVSTMPISAPVILRTVILAGLCAVVSVLFCLAIKYTPMYTKKLVKNEYVRAAVGGAVIVVLSLLLQTTDYNGAGMGVIDRAMAGEASYEAFILKIIFTAITVAAGFKGGEIVPTLFVGATFGCSVGALLGLDPAFAASLGFVAVFAGVVNCPLASVVLAVEVFGSNGVLLYALACLVAYILSGNFSIYEHKVQPFEFSWKKNQKGLIMKYAIDNDLHIHSQISACSADPEQTPERMLAYATENGLKTICQTDHFWDESVEGASAWYKPQNYERISKAKPLPQSDNVRFLFGCETELNKDLTLGLSAEKYDLFDFIIIPTTHFHMSGFTLSAEESESPQNRAAAWIKRFDAVLDMNLPFHKVGIAHLTCGLIAPTRDVFLETLNLIPDDEMERLFTKAAQLGVGIELNASCMNFADEETDTVLRPYRIAKKCGCKFYLGSDAHHPDRFEKAKGLFERAVNLLELTEEDKFKI